MDEHIDPDDLATLGAAVRARRLDLGWSQEDLARRVRALGVPMRQTDVSHLERGNVAMPRRGRLHALAAALALPVGELLTRSRRADPDRDP